MLTMINRVMLYSDVFRDMRKALTSTETALDLDLRVGSLGIPESDGRRVGKIHSFADLLPVFCDHFWLPSCAVVCRRR